MNVIVFLCKGNICRSPAAVIIAKQLIKRDDIEFLSAATTCKTQGQLTDSGMYKALIAHGYKPTMKPVVHMERLKECKILDVADKVVWYDLHKLGIHDPFNDKNYGLTIRQIEDFIRGLVL